MYAKNGVWVKCGPADVRTGKLRTKFADRVRILPTCVASCHLPRSQRRTNYLVDPRLHTCHGSLIPSLPSLTFLPPLLRGSSPVPSPFPFPSPRGALAEIEFGAF